MKCRDNLEKGNVEEIIEIEVNIQSTSNFIYITSKIT